jgi:hypothetical protein
MLTKRKAPKWFPLICSIGVMITAIIIFILLDLTDTFLVAFMIIGGVGIASLLLWYYANAHITKDRWWK